MKTSLGTLVRAHYRTLRDAQTNGKRAWDYILFVGLPVIALAIGCALTVELPRAAAAALLTTSGILSAFFFGVMLQLAQRAMEWAAENPPRGPETSWQATFLQEIAANAGYGSLVSLVTATACVAALIAKNEALAVASSALALALALHLALMLMLVLTRLFALTSDRLKKARVAGSDEKVTPFRSSKKTSAGS